MYDAGRTPAGTGVVVGPLGTTGVKPAAAGVVGTALVGVPGTGVETPGVEVTPACGVMTVPTVVIACGVPAVPPATDVCAAAVCFANSSIIAIGFSTDGKGETNSPVGSKVGVATGAADSDCVQAEINIVDTIKMKTTSKPRCLLLIVSPLSIYSTNDGST